MTYDAIIVGGGPAGCNAALILGRCRRNVLIVDAQQPRNQSSDALHGFLSRDGQPPRDVMRQAWADLSPYETVHRDHSFVTDVARNAGGFCLTLADGREVTGHKLLLATGAVDRLPQMPRFGEFYGKTVHTCPYCDAWEHRDQPMSVYGFASRAVSLAQMLQRWSNDITLCSDGRSDFTRSECDALKACGIALIEKPIATLSGSGSKLDGIVFRDGSRLDCVTMFTALGLECRSTLFDRLGCERDKDGSLIIDPVSEETTASGVYAAGDASRDVLLVVVAAAEGAKAAIAIDRALVKIHEKKAAVAAAPGPRVADHRVISGVTGLS